MKRISRESISATQISSMVYCEASVNSTRYYTKSDKRRIKRGNFEHYKYEKSLKKGRIIGSKHKVSRISPAYYFKSFLISVILLSITAIFLYPIIKAFFN